MSVCNYFGYHGIAILSQVSGSGVDLILLNVLKFPRVARLTRVSSVRKSL